MPDFKPDHVLFLNQLADSVAGGGDRLRERIEPTKVFLRPGFRLTLSGSGFNRVRNLQLPDGERFEWVVPATGREWSNTDVAAFTHLLSLARLRFSPPRQDGTHPLPADFVAALVAQAG